MINAIRGFAQKYFTPTSIRSLVLIYLLFLMLGNALRDSIQGVENSLLMLMIAVGILLGWILAISNITSWKTGLIAFFSGGIILTIRVGRLGNLIWALFVEIIELGNKTWGWAFQQGDIPRSNTISVGVAELGAKTLILGTRLGVWIQSLFLGKPIFDPVATAIIWGLLIWMIAVWATWVTIQVKKPMLGVIPILTITSLSMVYTGKSAYFLVPMMGFMIGLVVMGRYDADEDQWKEEKIEFAGIIKERMLVFTIAMAFAVMVLAASSPSVSIRSIVDFIDRITSDNVNEDDLVRSLGLEPPGRAGNINILDSRQSGGLPNRHLIVSGEELSDQIVLIIQVQELSEIEPETLDPAEKGYYWRSLTYDQYVGRGWVSRDSSDQEYQPGEKTLTSWPNNYKITRQKVEYVDDLSGLVFSAGIPLSIDQPFEVAWRVKNTNQETFDIFGASLYKDQYTADSLQPVASTIELQETGQDYPNWIRNRYIGLPDSVPERVLALARDITATEPTPYDRALAIETFLRRFPYTLDIPQPPLDQDITDYFLFVAKRGYCDYYATAMVVLSRAAGLPARLVTGYIGGYYDETLNAYLITADLAHAWAEIYFPGYGWIIFEPTGGRPEIDRPADPIPKFSQDYASSFDPLVPEKASIEVKWWVILLVSPFLLSIILFTMFLVDEVILINLPHERQLNLIYRRIYKYARWCDYVSLPGDTGIEFSRKFIHSINQYGRRSRGAEWLIPAIDLLRDLTRAYYLVNYSSAGSKSVNPRETALTFRNLRSRLWYLWILVHAYPYWLLRFFLWDSAPTIISPAPKQS